MDEPFTAIFNRQGELVKALVLPEDVTINPEKTTGEPQQTPPDGGPGGTSEQEQFRSAIWLGTAVTAEDGNIYLMRASSTPVVYVISSSGSVLRSLRIEPPAENFRPITMKVASGKVVVEFEENQPVGGFAQAIYVVAEATTGETLRHYVRRPGGAGGAFACYTASGFTFLREDEAGQFIIQQSRAY
jgi:hypothetical protein